MNRRRLKRLAGFLETLELERGDSFHMDSWVSHWNCHTAACALGWAALSPRFRDLKCKPNEFNPIRYRSGKGYNAGRLYFDIRLETARRLFSPDRYRQKRVTKQIVARRVRLLLEVGEAELEKRCEA